MRNARSGCTAMKRTIAGLISALILLACEPPQQDAQIPSWAYPINPPGAPRPADDEEQLRLSGSSQTYTEAQLRDLFNAPDWRPQDHPSMPDVVARGRAPDVRACGFCHLPTGDGRPENARLAGLPYNYIVDQMLAYRSGERRSSVAGRLPTEIMTSVGQAATDEEIASAAAYFSSLEPHSFLRVVETQTVPLPQARGWIWRTDDGGRTEPLGERVIETPEDFHVFERRDPDTRYIAYVPVGSVARGAELARSWGEQSSMACTLCHGQALQGVGDVPPLAGRSPSYLARQLNDFRTGARGGAQSEAMRPVVNSMSNAEIVAITAYLASLPTQP